MSVILAVSRCVQFSLLQFWTRVWSSDHADRLTTGCSKPKLSASTNGGVFPQYRDDQSAAFASGSIKASSFSVPSVSSSVASAFAFSVALFDAGPAYFASIAHAWEREGEREGRK